MPYLIPQFGYEACEKERVIADCHLAGRDRNLQLRLQNLPRSLKARMPYRLASIC
jgi:hypothetical protein